MLVHLSKEMLEVLFYSTIRGDGVLRYTTEFFYCGKRFKNLSFVQKQSNFLQNFNFSDVPSKIIAINLQKKKNCKSHFVLDNLKGTYKDIKV